MPDPRSVHVCILRAGGTNCDAETARAFREFGASVEIVRGTSLFKAGELDAYDILVIPGGFSYGDYIRAGAIWGSGLRSRLGLQLKEYVASGRLVMGLCNGFQVLAEAGLLPGFNGMSEYPEMSVTTNVSARYECRWTTRDDYLYLKHESRGNCSFTRTLRAGSIIRIPIGHGEGRILFPDSKAQDCLEKLVENDQIVFRYALEDGSYPEGAYPFNPNGSFYDIAGICNPEGNVLGMMPHPERALFGWQLPDHTCMSDMPVYGDGAELFRSAVEHTMGRL